MGRGNPIINYLFCFASRECCTGHWQAGCGYEDKTVCFTSRVFLTGQRPAGLGYENNTDCFVMQSVLEIKS